MYTSEAGGEEILVAASSYSSHVVLKDQQKLMWYTRKGDERMKTKTPPWNISHKGFDIKKI